MDAPDTLNDGNGGVRRLNRRPLMIVGVVVMMVFGIVAYTMAQRAADNDAARKSDGKKVIDPVGLDSLFTNAPVSGLIGAAVDPVVPDSIDAPLFTASGAPTDRPTAQAAGSVPVANEQYVREWELYRQQVNQVQQAKLQAAMSALSAAPSVQATRSEQGGSGAGSKGGVGAASEPDDVAAGLRAAAASMLGRSQGSAATGGSDGELSDANNAAGKVDWLKRAANADHYLKNGREAALSKYELKAGSVIPGVMIGGINADLPGQIIGQVRENVYDSATGDRLLIPQGSRLIGTYDNQVTRGQSRVLVAWNRIIYPDASSIDLEVMPGVDQAGFAGFKDKVNNHYFRVFGDSLLMSLFAAGIQLSQPQSSSDGGAYDSQQIIAGSLGQQLGQTGQQLAQQNLRIQPTLEIRPGYRFAVMVTKDMILQPWEPM